MKLLLKRDQKKAMMGGAKFILTARAEMTAEEKTAVKKYDMGKELLYEAKTLIDKGSGLIGVASRLAHHATNTTISIGDLMYGKSIECKDILQMLAIEGQVREAAQTFKDVLDAAMTFGGEEVIEL